MPRRLRVTPIRWGVLLLTVGAVACNSPEKDFVKASTENTIDAYQRFISQHQRDGGLVTKANEKICTLLRKTATEQNTVAAYDAFLEKCSNHSSADEMKKSLCSAFFAKTPAAELARGSDDFVKTHPQCSLYEWMRGAASSEQVAALMGSIQIRPKDDRSSKALKKIKLLWMKAEDDKKSEDLRKKVKPTMRLASSGAWRIEPMFPGEYAVLLEDSRDGKMLQVLLFGSVKIGSGAEINFDLEDRWGKASKEGTNKGQAKDQSARPEEKEREVDEVAFDCPECSRGA
jgi:hypothetical protein